MTDITISVDRIRVQISSSVDVFKVRLESKNGIYEQSCTSEEKVRMFLEGAKATASMCGMPDLVASLIAVEIPQKPSRVVDLLHAVSK